MTFSLERSLIETYINDNWNATPFSLDEESSTPDAPFVRFTINPGRARQVSVGAPGQNRARTPGIMVAQVIVAGGVGSHQARGFADQIYALFVNRKLGNVSFLIPYCSAKFPDSPNLIWNMTCPYRRDDNNA